MTPEEVAAVLAEHKSFTSWDSHDYCDVCLARGDMAEPWPCLPYRLASLVSEQAAALARAWDEGRAAGASRAMRAMSDEPGLSLYPTNPYRAALAGEQP